MFFYKFFQILLFVPLRLLFPTKVIGKQNLPKGNVVLACNHRSNADVLVLGVCVWRPQHFLAKKELFSKPIAPILRMLKAIPIDRQNPELSSIKKCLQVLKNGKVLTIFPQGTRKDVDQMEFKQGVIMFATKTSSPIVPMFLQKKPKLFRKNTLVIGQPIYLEDIFGKKYTDEQLEQAEKTLLLAFSQLQNQIKKQ